MTDHLSEPVAYTYRRWRFNPNDRLTIDGCHYVVSKKRKRTDDHVLHRVADGFVENFCIRKSDEEIGRLIGKKRLTVSEGYFSRAETRLRFRRDDSAQLDLSEEQYRTVRWRRKWVEAFLGALTDCDAGWRPRITDEDIALFVERSRDAIHDWYIGKFGESRRPGRKYVGRDRKPFDWPCPSALRKWATAFAEDNYREGGLCPKTSRCGNRRQLSQEVVAVIEDNVHRSTSLERPLMKDIIDDVNTELARINRGRDPEQALKVGAAAVRRRIKRIAPFIRDLGAKGEKRTIAHYTGVGKGSIVEHLLQRVEMDDWEADMFALIQKSRAWKRLSSEARRKVPRVRCNVSAAIDCRSNAIVGISLSPQAPSTGTTRATLRSVLSDKSTLAGWVEAKGNWPMFGRPEMVATDGGPALRGDVDEVLRHVAAPRSMPEQDPRLRGTIEAFFKKLKKVCRFFAGRAFANVVEKGDYAGEELATLTVEEFQRAVIRWIVDYYHHAPQPALGGHTPYAVWETLSQTGMGCPPPPSDEQMALAFGLKQSCTVDRYGVRYLNLYYNSAELAHLHRLVGSRKLSVFVDPEEIGEALVLVPIEHRKDPAFGERHLLRVPCIDRSAVGRTLVDLILRNKAYAEAAARSDEEGKSLRLAAVADLLEGGERARREAGLPSAYVSQSQLDRVAKIIDRKERAAFEDVDNCGKPDLPDPESFGTSVARPTKTKPLPGLALRAPSPVVASVPDVSSGRDVPATNVIVEEAPRTTVRSRSINMYEEDE